LPDRADHRIGLDRRLAAGGVAEAERTAARRLVEPRLDHLGPEADLRADAVVAGAALEVVAQLVPPREELRPVVVRRERVAVEVVRDVHPAAGIGVLEPRAADPVLLLEADVR